MSEPEKGLTIQYEGEKKILPVKSSLKEIEQEFKKEFNISENFPFYLYFKENDEDDIILDEDSFPEFIELEITELFGEKKIEENSQKDVENIECTSSDFDLFIQELEKERNKIKKGKEKKDNNKNMMIKSKETEVQYFKIKNIFDIKMEQKLIQELQNKSSNLMRDKNKLKDQIKNLEKSILKMEQSQKIKRQYEISNKTYFQYNKVINTKFLEKDREIDKLKNDNRESKKKIKDLEKKIQTCNEKIISFEEIEENYKMEIQKLSNSIEDHKCIIEIKKKDYEENLKLEKKRIKMLKKEIDKLENELENQSKINQDISLSIPKNLSHENQKEFNLNITPKSAFSSKKLSRSDELFTQKKISKLVSKKNIRAKLINEINKSNKKTMSRANTIKDFDFRSIKIEEERQKSSKRTGKIINNFKSNKEDEANENLFKSMNLKNEKKI